MDNLNPCPYLRMKDDPDTYAGYPSRMNHCHHASPQQAVAPLYQKDVCLTNAHQNCPIFKREGVWPGKLPNEIRTDAAYEAAIKKQGVQAVAPTVEQRPASTAQSVAVPPEPVTSTIAPSIFEGESDRSELAPLELEIAPSEVEPEPDSSPSEISEPEIEPSPATNEASVELIEALPPELGYLNLGPPEETEPALSEAPAKPIQPVPPKSKRVRPPNQIDPENLPDPDSDFEPMVESNEAVSPLKVAAEAQSSERPKHRASTARPAREIPRHVMLVLGIIGAIGVCVLLGVGASLIARNLMSAIPPATATGTLAATTATIDEVGTATAAALSITASPIPSTPTTAASTAVPISVQDTRMRFDGNLRSGPGTEYPLIGEVTAGTSVSVIGRDELGVWLAVRLGSGQEGWIPASQVNTDSINVLSAPVLEVPSP